MIKKVFSIVNYFSCGLICIFVLVVPRIFLNMYFSPRTPEQGVYEFPRLTLLGFDTGEPQLRRLSQLGLKVGIVNI